MGMYPSIVPNTTYGRVYEVAEGVYFPSVSTIPRYGLPLDEYLFKWFIEKSKGDYDRHIHQAGEASEIGTAVHLFAEELLAGHEVHIPQNPHEITDKDGNKLISGRNYFATHKTTSQIKKGIASFVAWHETLKPTLIASEELLYCLDKNDKGEFKFPFCGRCDLVMDIEGERWLLDIKTSVNVKNQKAMQVQLSIYKRLWDVTHDRPIDRMGIIWAKKDWGKQPTKSVREIHEYDFDWGFVKDTHTMFLRFYEGFELGKPKIRNTLPNTFKLEAI